MPLQSEGFTAWISVDDAELDCYNVEAMNDGKKVTCWIASEAGKKFAVNWTRPLPVKSDMLSGVVVVDGIKCTGMLMDPKSHSAVFSRSSLPTSHTTVKPFLFGDLELTDDDAFLEASTSADLGTITLNIWRIERVGYHSAYDKPPMERKIHERTKKATVHMVKLGEDVKRPFAELVEIRNLDKDPVTTFVFMYRPLDVLRANNIVPLNVGQNHPAPAVFELENVKEEPHFDEDANAARIKALENELEELRKKASGSKANPAKRVKLEPKGFVSGEVIDLT